MEFLENIGSRQRGRERSENVLDVDYDKDQIINAVNKQLSVNKYNKDFLFGNGTAGDKIAVVLESTTISINKSLNYLD